jgi:Family of unknown function (DUF6152)
MQTLYSIADPIGGTMRTRLALIIGLVVSTVIPAFAHHSFDAEYDSTKTMTIVGFVTKVDWVNPHAFVYLDSKDDKGVVHTYRVEMGPPYALARSGWKKDTLKVGDKITIENAALAKDGSNTAGSMPQTSMTLAGGQKMVMR